MKCHVTYFTDNIKHFSGIVKCLIIFSSALFVLWMFIASGKSYHIVITTLAAADQQDGLVMQVLSFYFFCKLETSREK